VLAFFLLDDCGFDRGDRALLRVSRHNVGGLSCDFLDNHVLGMVQNNSDAPDSKIDRSGSLSHTNRKR
jgi:hypothetical protein